MRDTGVMSDPKQQAATQLRNIEEATGKSVVDFAALVDAAGIEKHGQIVAFLKRDHGLTHGNANLMAHSIRERAAGGPATADELLEAQYAKGKAALRPIYERLAEIALGCGDDVEMVVQKTGVSFRRKKQFALVQAPSSKRIQLGLNLPSDPAGDRVTAASGMCSHRADITTLDAVDGEVAAWLQAAYDGAE